MPKKRFSAKQIVTLLRQIEALMAQGKSAPVACRDVSAAVCESRFWNMTMSTQVAFSYNFYFTPLRLASLIVVIPVPLIRTRAPIGAIRPWNRLYRQLQD